MVFCSCTGTQTSTEMGAEATPEANRRTLFSKTILHTVVGIIIFLANPKDPRRISIRFLHMFPALWARGLRFCEIRSEDA